MGYFYLAVAMVLNASANVLFKLGAGQLGDLHAPGLMGRLVSNYPLLGGLLLFALNTVFYAAALTRLDLAVAYPAMTVGGIVIVVTVSLVFLSENLTALQLFGLTFVLLGLVLLTRGGSG